MNSNMSDKSIYINWRGKMTRAEASELLNMSESRLEKIETGKTAIQPSDILAMAEAYDRPDICNYYCSHECEIGRLHVPSISSKELSQITLEILATLNSLNKTKERFVEITVDGEISDDEMQDFIKIQDDLNNMSLAVETLKLWVNTKIKHQ